MSCVLAAALMLVWCSAAASLILALPIAVAAESLYNAPPAVARRFWLIVNVLPLLCGLVLTATGFLLLSDDIGANPHQLRVRPHLCLKQITDLPDAPFRFQLYALLALGLITFALVRLFWGAASSARAQRIAHRLREATERVGKTEVFVLEAAEANCFSLGLTEPLIVVTEGLKAALGEQELAAVLAHEQCHIGHDDVPAQLALRALGDPLIFLPTTHYYLRAARAAMEHTCDAVAAEQTSAEALASALRKLAALKQARQLKFEGDLAPLKPTFPGHSEPQRRLAALSGSRELSIALPLRAILWIETVLLVMALAWLAEPLHDTLYCWAQSLLTVLRL